MSHPQLSPLLLNATTGEPYLRLPSPHSNIIITPPRMNDVPSLLHHLNDFAVCRWLSGPPQPYLQHHAEEFLAKVKAASDAVLQELTPGSEQTVQSTKLVGTCPVRTLREVKPDGTDIMLGDVDMHRCEFLDVQDPQERKRLEDENMQRPSGDPGIIWCIGDYLASSHHGRGIMSAAVATMITKWMIPRMGAHLIRVEAFKGNVGSVRVFEKNGFVLEETVDFEQVINSGQKNDRDAYQWWRS